MGTWRKLEKSVKRELNYIERKVLRPIGDTIQAVVEDPKKLIGVALSIAFPGAGTAIGSALGLTGTAAAVVGQTVINTVVNGGDVKSAVISAALPIVGKEVASNIGVALDSSNVTGTVNNIITRGAAQGATAAILGKDPAAAFLMGGVSAGVGAITSSIPEFSALPQSAQNAINSALGTKLLGGDVAGAVTDTAINDAISWARKEINKAPAAIKDAKDTYKAQTGQDLSDEQLENLIKTNGVEGLKASIDKSYTTKEEAKNLWKNAFGEDPTEEQIDSLVGKDVSSAMSLLQDRAISESAGQRERLLDDYAKMIGKSGAADLNESESSYFFDKLDKVGIAPSVLKNASASDILTGNYSPASPAYSKFVDGNLHIEAVGSAYHEARQPPAGTFDLPAGARYATMEEIDDPSKSGARYTYTKTGEPVWISYAPTDGYGSLWNTDFFVDAAPSSRPSGGPAIAPPIGGATGETIPSIPSIPGATGSAAPGKAPGGTGARGGTPGSAVIRGPVPGQINNQIQQILGSQPPQVVQAAPTVYEPIYGKGVDYFDPFAPLDVNYLGNRDENQGSQPGQQATKISSGGYMDDLIRILKG